MHDDRFWRAVALGGGLGAADSYLAGWWDSADLTSLVCLLARNRAVANRLEAGIARLRQLADRLRHAARANTRRGSRRNIEAHYDLGDELFALFLDPSMTYSAAFFERPDATLEEAQIAKIDRLCRKLRLGPRDHLLEIGTGWGSLAIHAAGVYGCRVTTTTISPAQHAAAARRIAAAGLGDRSLSFYLAERFPACAILAVSNSHSQGAFITAEAARRGLANLRHQVADVNRFVTAERFHRIVSVEMMEHVRNHAELFHRLAAWLHPGGGLFVHVFCHRDLTYPFDDGGPGDWMARHFFTGGMMPAADLLPACGGPFELDARYEASGMHYARTTAAWLARLDVARDRVLPLFEHTYGRGRGRRWIERWRIFFMACAELFAAGNGSDWFVSHYRFVLPASPGNRRRPAGFRVVRGAGAARWRSPTPS